MRLKHFVNQHIVLEAILVLFKLYCFIPYGLLPFQLPHINFENWGQTQKSYRRIQNLLYHSYNFIIVNGYFSIFFYQNIHFRSFIFSEHCPRHCLTNLLVFFLSICKVHPDRVEDILKLRKAAQVIPYYTSVGIEP